MTSLQLGPRQKVVILKSGAIRLRTTGLGNSGLAHPRGQMKQSTQVAAWKRIITFICLLTSTAVPLLHPSLEKEERDGVEEEV